MAILQFLTTLFCLLSAFSDPGTIPMREYLRDVRGKLLDSIPVNVSAYSYEKFDHKFYMHHHGLTAKLKFCATCEIFRPPRTVHCRLCNVCILRLDHHCPWVGNCIGVNNYPYFLCFVNITGILLLEIFAVTGWFLH